MGNKVCGFFVVKRQSLQITIDRPLLIITFGQKYILLHVKIIFTYPQFRMFWAHSRSVSLASRPTGVPAMFNMWEERDMHDKRSHCLLNRRPMLSSKVHLISSKVHLVSSKLYLVNSKQNFLT